jgi:integrase
MVAITKRKDGRFVAKVTIDGRRHCVYGRSEAEVRSKLEELERQLLLGQPPVPGRLTVAQWLEAWYEAERSRWRPRTAHDYRKLLDTLILPRIGRVRLSAMSPMRWQRFFDSFSGRTATLVFSVIRRAGVCATRWRWLPENPTKLVVPPHHRPRRIELPGRDALVRLAEHCRTSADPGAPLVLFVLCTGLRLGEAASLRWGDIDWEAGLVHVQRAGQWVGGRWTETPPKTAAGRRTIVLGELAVEALRRQHEQVTRWREQAGPAWGNDLVFPRWPSGQPLTPKYASVVLGRLCRAAGVARLHFHLLRHAHASLALVGGAPVADVSARLGHSTPHVTLSVYSHALGGSRTVAMTVERALSR